MILQKVKRCKAPAADLSEPSISVFARRELFRRVGEVLDAQNERRDPARHANWWGMYSKTAAGIGRGRRAAPPRQ